MLTCFIGKRFFVTTVTMSRRYCRYYDGGKHTPTPEETIPIPPDTQHPVHADLAVVVQATARRAALRGFEAGILIATAIFGLVLAVAHWRGAL